MKRVVLLVISFAVSPWVHAQQQFILSVKQDKLKAFITLEQNLRSTRKRILYTVDVSDDLYPGAGKLKSVVGQPAVFDRPDGYFTPSPYVYYYFNKSDSMVRLIEYDWDAVTKMLPSVSEMAQMGEKQLARKKEYEVKYDTLFAQIKRKLGAPLADKNGTPLITHHEDNADSEEREAEWQTKTATVELFLVFEPKKLAIGTYRIRVLVYWND